MRTVKEIIWIAYAAVFKPLNSGNFMSNPVSSWFHPPLAPPKRGFYE